MGVTLTTSDYIFFIIFCVCLYFRNTFSFYVSDAMAIDCDGDFYSYIAYIFC